MYFLACFILSKNKEFCFFVFTVLLSQSVSYVVLFFCGCIEFLLKAYLWLARKKLPFAII